MNILYFHANLLRNNYRCDQVRQRLREFIAQSSIDVILISGIDDTHTRQLNEMQEFLSEINIPLISKNGSYQIKDSYIAMDEAGLAIQDKRFFPLDGTVMVIETDPILTGNYVTLDLFADESFADYHSTLDSATMVDDIRKLMNHKDAMNKNRFN